MKLQIQVLQAKTIQGRKDPSKNYTIVEGLVTLPDGKQSFAECFLQGTQHFVPGSYELELEIRVDRQTRRIVAEPRSILPVRSPVSVPASARAAA